MQGWERVAVRAGAAGARYAAVALLVALGVALPLTAQASVYLWKSLDGGTAIVRNAAGRPVTIDLARPGLPFSTTGGNGAMAATQRLAVGGASAELALSRAVSVGTIARGLRIASGLAGPIGMIGLAYEGITWAVDHWEASEATAGGGVCHNVNEGNPDYGCTRNACSIGVGAVASGWSYVNWPEWEGQAKPSTFTIAYLNNQPAPAGWRVINNCTAYGSQGGYFPSALVKASAPGTLPATDAQVESSLTNALQADPTKAGPMIEWIAEAVPEYDFQPGPVQVTGPSSVQGPVETATRQEGGNTYTTTSQSTYNLTFQGDTVTVTTTTNSTTVDQNNNVVQQTTTTTQAPANNDPEPAAAPAEDLECGLPGTPPCKLDETGTPTASSTVSAGQAALTSAFDARDAQVAAQTQRESFGWLPELPTLNASCSTIQVGNIWTFDPCPGIEIGRTFFAFLWGFLALIYCWRRVGETVAGGV